MDNSIEDTQIADPRDTPAEEFYNNPDSCYIRIKWDKELNAYRFEVRNELYFQYTEETLPEPAKALSIYVRGMVEVAMANPHDLYKLGEKAFNNDYIRRSEELSEEFKSLLLKEPVGNA